MDSESGRRSCRPSQTLWSSRRWARPARNRSGSGVRPRCARCWSGSASTPRSRARGRARRRRRAGNRDRREELLGVRELAAETGIPKSSQDLVEWLETTGKVVATPASWTLSEASASYTPDTRTHCPMGSELLRQGTRTPGTPMTMTRRTSHDDEQWADDRDRRGPDRRGARAGQPGRSRWRVPPAGSANVPPSATRCGVERAGRRGWCRWPSPRSCPTSPMLSRCKQGSHLTGSCGS